MTSNNKTRAKVIRIAAGVAGVGLVIALAVVLATGVQTNDQVSSTEFAEDFDPVKGNPKAKVTIQEFADFQCPACKSAQIAISQLFMEFKDQVKLEYENLPLPSHHMAIPTALAGECAATQSEELFWSLSDTLYETQEDWATATSDAFIFQEAETIGLDMIEFRSCMVSEQAQDKVQVDLDEARELNISSTPTFFVNGERFVGGSYPELSSLVKAALDE